MGGRKGSYQIGMRYLVFPNVLFSVRGFVRPVEKLRFKESSQCLLVISSSGQTNLSNGPPPIASDLRLKLKLK
jgi:hypothetical protein